MIHVTTAFDIAASPKVVFPWLIEPDPLARWVGGFVGSEAITEGPTRVGRVGLVTCSTRRDVEW